MTKPFPFEDETFDIIFNPVSNVYIDDLENMYKRKPLGVLKKGGLLMVGFMNPWIYMYDADVCMGPTRRGITVKVLHPI